MAATHVAPATGTKDICQRGKQESWDSQPKEREKQTRQQDWRLLITFTGKQIIESMIHAVTGEKTEVYNAQLPRSEHLNKIYIAYKEL